MSKHFFDVSEDETYMAQLKDGEIYQIKYYAILENYLYRRREHWEETEFKLDSDKENWSTAKEILKECLIKDHEEFRDLGKKLKKGSKGYKLVDKIVSKRMKKASSNEAKQLRKIQRKMK